MSMSIEVRINDEVIARTLIVNQTGGAADDDVNVYRWKFQGENGRLLHDTLEHRYGDGAMILASEVLERVAQRYRVANAVRRGIDLRDPRSAQRPDEPNETSAPSCQG